MDPSWLTGIGTLVLAVATLILAGVTVWAVRSSNEANRLLREENRQLHERERNRIANLQALEIVSNWADKVARIIGKEKFSLQSGGSVNEFLYKFNDIDLDKESVDRASKLFEDRFQDLVSKALSHINIFEKTLYNLRDSYLQTPKIDKEELKNRVVENQVGALNATFRLQEYVREHKVSILI